MNSSNMYKRLANIKKKVGYIEPDMAVSYGGSRAMPYVSFGKIRSVIDPLLEEEQIGLTISSITIKEDRICNVRVEIVDLVDGLVGMVYEYEFIMDDSKNRSGIQNSGSTMSYILRYVYKLIFELSSTELDPDLDNPHSNVSDRYEKYIKLVRAIPEEDKAVKIFKGLVEGKLDYEKIKNKYSKNK